MGQENIYRQAKFYDVPSLDILTLLFDSEKCFAQEDTAIHISAANPTLSITKREARTLTKRFAHTLRTKYGIGASGPFNDVVSVMSSGQIMLPMLFYGVIAAGSVYSAASSAAVPAELARQVTEAGSKLIVCSPDCRAVAVEAANIAGVEKRRVLVLQSEPEGELVGVDGGENLIGTKELDWVRVTDKKVLAESLICLLYSSGTTGVPKAVELSHQNVVAEAVIPGEMNREVHAKREAAGEPPFEYRTIAHLPAAHIAGVQGYLINPFYAGGPVYWMPKFDFPKFLEYNKKYCITFFFTVPPVYLLIAKSPLVTDQFDSLRIAISGAAPMGKELQYLASSKLGKGGCFISQTWGLSETTGSVTAMAWDQSDDTGSVSPLPPNISMRIVDEDLKDVEEGKPGEVLIKGPVVTKGYYKNPTATAEAFIDGWFKTGDIALVRESKIYVVDRKKELIKYKGFQVAPAELEALLLSHTLISDAAVIGVESEGTEVPRAYVVADKTHISEARIMAFVKERAAGYKQLRGGMVFVDAIPKSPAGKILRKDLGEMVKREMGGKAKL